MLGPTHLLFGVAAFTAAEVAARAGSGETLFQSTPAGLLLGVSAAMLGALAPDLDAEDSTIHQELGWFSWPVKVGLALLGVKHRGVLHSGVALLAVCLGAGLMGWQTGWWEVGLAFALGYISHVAVADALTISGVPLWWPVERRFHLLPRPLRVRTGGPVEKLVVLGMGVLLVWLLPQAVPPEWVSLAQRWLS
jgi:membrane-bound metal-dependent hydrolase YbcI (DUF457 family)